MLDDDLNVRFRALDDDRKQVIDDDGDTKLWDVELAYVRREQQLRRQRRDAHAVYLRNESTAFALEEFGLPAGDFDNSAYVYAATGGRPRWN